MDIFDYLWMTTYGILMIVNFHFAVRGILEDRLLRTVMSGGVFVLMVIGVIQPLAERYL